MKKSEDIASGTEPLEQPGDGNRKVNALVRCCGGCFHFDSEDISGGGWCNAADHATSCGDSCPDWHDDFYTPNEKDDLQ